MPEYLILKLEGDGPRDIRGVTRVVSDEAPGDLLPQGFDGEGRYAVVDWSERVEADLGRGPVKATAVQDKAARQKGG